MIDADPISLFSGGNDVRRAMTWAITFALCWAVLEIGLGSLLRNPYPLLQIVWCRYAAHLSVAAAIWAWRHPPMWRTGRPAFQLARSLLMLTMPGAFTWAVTTGVSADFVWTVFWIAPLLIIAFAGVALRERPPAVVLIAAALGAIAAGAIFGHLHAASPLAIALALAVSLSFSLYVVMTRSLRTEPVAANLFYTAIVPFLVLTPLMFQIGVWPSLHDAAVMVSIGVVGFGALYALDRACHAAPAWASSGALLVQAACVGLVFLIAGEHGETLRIAFGAGAIVALVGLLWMRARRLAPA